MKTHFLERRDFMKSMAAAGTGLLLDPRALLAQQSPQPDPSVRRVLVMFKCHFDAGFIDTQYNVVHKYFRQYFPAAIEVARSANAAGKRNYVWTTGSWLLYEYLEQASPAERKTMEEAIGRGDIAWHALPFTWQTEMLTPSLIEGSLALSRSLDQRFGTTTTGAKMTDVPGHTRGIVAPLAKGGVTLLEIGTNGGSTAADAPPLFLWKDTTGATLPMMYHHDYGGLAHIPGSDTVLMTIVRGDNSGPHKPDEIAQIHARLSAQYPNAEIVASSLTDMANAVQPFRDKLPIVTQEMGDTWIHGCASDPLKVARYRAITRLREQWIAQGALQVSDATDLQLLRRMLLEPEHTWGTDTKTWLDFDNYEPADLAPMLDTKNYRVVEYSWIEKRQDQLDAIATLPQALRQQADLAIASLNPLWPVDSPRASKAEPAKPIDTAHFVLEIDPITGALSRLRNKTTSRNWAGPANPLALLTYQTLSQDDYQRFMRSYLTTKADWAQKDFGKPNIERFGAKSQDWHPRPASIRLEETADAHRILIELEFHDAQAFASGRASFPRHSFVEIVLPKSDPIIHLAVSCFGKPATRMPEALWLTFNPIAPDQHGWTLDKCGQTVSPFDVMISGNRHMHAVQSGFAYKSNSATLTIETIDAPVVALGERTPLLFSNDQPDLSKGVHSCLFNNAWGTNYIMWYGEDILSRYTIKA